MTTLIQSRVVEGEGAKYDRYTNLTPSFLYISKMLLHVCKFRGTDPCFAADYLTANGEHSTGDETEYSSDDENRYPPQMVLTPIPVSPVPPYEIDISEDPKPTILPRFSFEVKTTKYRCLVGISIIVINFRILNFFPLKSGNTCKVNFSFSGWGLKKMSRNFIFMELWEPCNFIICDDDDDDVLDV